MKQQSNTHREDETPQSQLEQAAIGKRIVSAKVSLFILGGLLLVAAATRLISADKTANLYVAHEWGTFTSVQGSDGVLLEWQPLETSQLPKFVYNWNNPGRGGPLYLTKGTMVSLQRMETPVIYFYSAHQQTVDVSVRFPRGVITEWYPQASEISRGTLPRLVVPAKSAEEAQKTGTAESSVIPSETRKESYAKWRRVTILPEKKNPDVKQSLPQDSSGSHYFAARMTDSDYLSSPAATNCSSENEKFIFYRGVGNFETPLRVTMSSENSVTLANTGHEALQHLFVLQLRDGAGNFLYVERLGPGQQEKVTLNSSLQTSRVDKLSHQLGELMAESLVKEGLFRREATAMVNTWKDSWFQEEGMRVLYVLPREWTERTLPLTLEPSPRELPRVMVGRAEVITPEVQKTFAESLTKAVAGDLEARQRTIVQMAKLGRFAEPAVRLVTKDATQQEKQGAWKLLYERPPTLKNQLSLVKQVETK